MSALDHLIPITEKDECLQAFEVFKTSFTDGAERFQDRYLVWQGGRAQVPVYWHGSSGIWGVFEEKPPKAKKNSNRFWNCFGIADPRKNEGLRITVEINQPHKGENRRCAGVFLHDEQGDLYVGHSGKLGGSRPGVGRQTFRTCSHQLEWRQIETSKGGREVVIFGPLRRGEVPEMLAPFIRAVAEFKEAAASQN